MFHTQENTTCEDFIKALTPLGFQYNYFSYTDKDQTCNIRKTYIHREKTSNNTIKTTLRQHHLRLYKDGEIRGHDEIAYEEDAIAHEKGKTLQPIPQLYQNDYKQAIRKYNIIKAKEENP